MLIAIFAAPRPAHAQVFASAGATVNNMGQPIGAALMSICSADPGDNPAPCSGTLVQTYTDYTLTTPCTLVTSPEQFYQYGFLWGPGCTNPGRVSTRANYTIYASPFTLYWAQVYGYGFTTYVMPFATAGLGGTTTPCGAQFDVQINEPLNHFGCDTTIFSENNSTHTLTMGTTGTPGNVITNEINLIAGVPPTFPGAGYAGLLAPAGANVQFQLPGTVGTDGQSIVQLSHSGNIATLGYGAGAVSAENVTPVMQSNSPAPATTNDIIYTPYTQATDVIFQGPPPNTFGEPYIGNAVSFGDATGSLSSCSVALSSTTAGNTILFSTRSDLASPTSITDSQGNTVSTLNSTGGTGFFYFKNIKGGNDTITAHYAGVTGCMIQAAEVVGADPVSPIFVDGGKTSGCTGQNPAFPSVTLSQPGTVIGMLIGHGLGSNGDSTYVANNGYFLPNQLSHYGGGGLGESRSVAMLWQAFGSTGSQTPAATANFGCGTDNYTIAVGKASGNTPTQPHFDLLRYTQTYNAMPTGPDFGVADAYVVAFNSCPPTLIPSVSSTWFVPANANTTTTPTLNWCSLGAEPITKNGQSALVAGDLIATKIAYLTWDGQFWELQNPATGGGGGSVNSVSGTSNQVDSTGGSTPVLSLSSSIVLPGTLSSSHAVDFSTASSFKPAGGGGTLTIGSANQNWATLGSGFVINTTLTGALLSVAATGTKCYPFQGSGGIGCDTPSGGSPAFNTITSGTNSGAAMIVGAGASLAPTSATAGVVSANELNGTLLAGLSTGLLRNTATTGVPSSSELSGAVSTAGSNFTTLASRYLWRSCTGLGLGDGVNPIPAATYPNLGCVNNSGATLTVTGVHCYSDNNGSSTLDVKNNAGTSFLTGVITCNNTKTSGGAAGTLGGTITLSATDAFNFVFISDGSSKTTTWTVDVTLP